MIWLLLCILLTSSFFLFFKYFAIYELNTFQAIVFNYLTCAVVGFLFSGGVEIEYFKGNSDWIIYAVGLGCLFITSFFLMAKTAQNISVAMSTVASKMSMIIPSLVSLYLFEHLRDSFGIYNVIGFIISLLALFFTAYKETNETSKLQWRNYLLIFAVFLGTGMVDSLLNIVENKFPEEAFKRGFPIFCFAIAFTIGVIVSFIIKKDKFELKNLIGGIGLGIPNYFSIYFLFKALDDFESNAAFVFPVLNISIIVLGAILAFMLFKERLTKLNYIGVMLSVLAVVLLSL